MQSVRNKSEYPSNADVVGATRFDGQLMRPVVVKNGQAAQNAWNGNVVTITAAYTVLPADGTVIINSASTFAVTLPLISAVEKGHKILFKKIQGTGVVTLTRAGSDTIDGGTTHAMTLQWRTVELQSDGTQWLITQAMTPAAA